MIDVQHDLVLTVDVHECGLTMWSDERACAMARAAWSRSSWVGDEDAVAQP